MDDYYEILHVSRRADPEVIKAAYNRLALKYHPDRNRHDASVEQVMKRLNAAWCVLGDPAARSAYDRKREEAAIHQAEQEAAATREETARREKAEAGERARKAEEARLAAVARAAADRKAAEEKAKRPDTHARRTGNRSHIRKPHWSPHWFDMVALLAATGVGLVAFASTARGIDMVRKGSTDAWYAGMLVIFGGGLVFADVLGLNDGRYWTVSVQLFLCLTATFGLGILHVSDISNATPETFGPFTFLLGADLLFMLLQHKRSKRHRPLR